MQYKNIQQLALENNNSRRVLFTNEHSQVVLMSILPGEDIGREVHEVVDLFWFCQRRGTCHRGTGNA